MGQSISDMFYPDNPERRGRAEQLRGDIQAFSTRFEEVKKSRDELLQQVKPQLAAFLAEAGYDTPEALDQKVQSVLTGEHLANYLDVKERHDKNSDIEATIFAICSYIAVGSGVFLTELALLGIITGGELFLVLGGVANALAAVAVVLVIIAMAEGEQERSNLRQAISQLLPERLKVRRAMVLMEAISNWVGHIKMFLESAAAIHNPSLAATLWEGDFERDFALSQHDPSVQWLEEYDRERGAWTNEDPADWKTEVQAEHRDAHVHVANVADGFVPGIMGPALRSVQKSAAMVKSQSIPQKPAQAQVTLQRHLDSGKIGRPFTMLVTEAGPDSCVGKDSEGNTWELVHDSIAPKHSASATSIANSTFSLRRTGRDEFLPKCSVVRISPFVRSAL